MIVPVFLAALAAVPAVAAQAVAAQVTSSATRCSTRFGYNPLTATGTETTVAVPTWYTSTTVYNVFSITTTAHSTVTITPNATTFMNVVTSTVTVLTTTSSTPSPVNIPTQAGFIPLIAVAMPAATGISRVKRAEIGGRDVPALLKRQTLDGYTGGFSVDEDGNTEDLNREYIQRIDCMVTYSINRTEMITVNGAPETVVLGAETATAVSTVTVSTTVTVTKVAPTPSVYAACQPNNIVDSIIDFNGNRLVFSQVVYRPAQGFPRNTETVVNTTSSLNCCIACQTTANCAASFYVPSKGNCHLRLTQPLANITSPYQTLPSGVPYPIGNLSNATYPLPTASGIFPRQISLATGTAISALPYGAYAYASGSAYIAAPQSTGVPLTTNTTLTSYNPAFSFPVNSNATCSSGSLSLYIGAIQGTETFPMRNALAFSNGPCGRLSVWPLPVVPGRDSSYDDPVPSREDAWARV